MALDHILSPDFIDGNQLLYKTHTPDTIHSESWFSASSHHRPKGWALPTSHTGGKATQ